MNAITNTNDMFVFRKGDLATGVEETCRYPESQGGDLVPIDLIPNLGFNAQQILSRDGIVVVDAQGEPHPDWEDQD